MRGLETRKLLPALIFLLLIGFTSGEQVKFEKGLEMEVEDVNFHLTMGQNYTLDISKIIEYSDTLQLGEKNLSVYAQGTSTRTNTTLNEYEVSPPYSNGESVINITTYASSGENVSFEFTGFRDLETGNYVLKLDGSQVKDFGTSGSFSWWNSSWSSKTYTVECQAASECTASADTNDPTVSASHSPSSPSSGENVTVEASASDSETGINKIEIFVDGYLNKTCSSSSCSYEASGFAGGTSHDYNATAYDGAGNVAGDNGSFSVSGSNTGGDDDSGSGGSGGGGGSSSGGSDDSGGSGGGGGGGFIGGISDSGDSDGPSIVFGKKEIRVKLDPGQSSSETLSVTNNGSEEKTVNLELEKIGNLVSVETGEMTLSAGESREVTMQVDTTGVESGGYSGQLNVGSRTLPLYVIVKSEQKAFEADINVGDQVFDTDEIPSFTVSTYNLGEEELQDAGLEVTVRNSNDNVVYRERRDGLQISDVDIFENKLGNVLPKGEYTVRVRAEANNETRYSGATFTVENQPEELPNKIAGFETERVLLFFGILAILGLVQAFFYFYEWNKNYDEEEERGVLRRTMAGLPFVGADQGAEPEEGEDSVGGREEKQQEKNEQSETSDEEASEGSDGEGLTSREDIRTRLKEIKTKVSNLENKRDRLKRQLDKGEIDREEYKSAVRDINEEEKKFKKEIEQLEKQL